MRFSVVVPARDAEDSIERALRSVLAQTYPAHEVLVVDDGSKDRTRERITALGDPRLIVLTGVSRGVAAARNLGIDHASGDWVAFLDGDDYWRPELLALAAVRIRAAPQAVACFCGATPVGDDGEVIGRHEMREVVTLEQLVSGRIVPTTSASLVRREAAIRCGRFFEGFARPAGVEDFDLWWRLAASGPCVGVPTSAAVYIVHDLRDGARSPADLADLEADREHVVDRLAARGHARALVRTGRAVMRAGTARYWLRAGQPTRARELARSSVRLLPTREGIATLVLASSPQPLRAVMVRARRRLRARTP